MSAATTRPLDRAKSCRGMQERISSGSTAGDWVPFADLSGRGGEGRGNSEAGFRVGGVGLAREGGARPGVRESAGRVVARRLSCHGGRAEKPQDSRFRAHPRGGGLLLRPQSGLNGDGADTFGIGAITRCASGVAVTVKKRNRHGDPDQERIVAGLFKLANARTNRDIRNTGRAGGVLHRPDGLITWS